MHNRRKRAAWLLDQQTRHRAAITEARETLARGEHITEDQMLLLNQERAALEAEQASKNRPGLFTKAKNAVYESVPEVESKGGELARQAREGFQQAKSEAQFAAEDKFDGMGVKEAVQEKMEQGRQKVAGGLHEVEARAGEMLQKPAVADGRVVLGGPLDKQAQAVIDKAKAESQSWVDWVMRR